MLGVSGDMPHEFVLVTATHPEHVVVLNVVGAGYVHNATGAVDAVAGVTDASGLAFADPFMLVYIVAVYNGFNDVGAGTFLLCFVEGRLIDSNALVSRAHFLATPYGALRELRAHVLPRSPALPTCSVACQRRLFSSVVCSCS